LTLEQLIAACKKNNMNAQEQLYRQFSSKLFAVSVKYSRNYVEAQDNLQDGFLLILNKIKKFENKGSFEGWAKRVLINSILEQYRKATFLEIVSDEIPEQIDVELETEDVSIEFLMQIIQELPDRYRLVFNLYAVDDYSHKEISEQLNISVGTSKSNLSRARMILKNKIENQKKIKFQ
jgi:RNA polymerase sigma factor (sigma-70 family)